MRLRYDLPMKRHRLRQILRLKKHAFKPAGPTESICDAEAARGSSMTARVIGWSSLAFGVAALGVFIGREIRVRYKFSHRTPYDYYAHSADRARSVDYVIGI